MAAGAVAALGLSRFLASLLFGIGPSDPATFGGVALLLSAVVLAACVIPARERAARRSQHRPYATEDNA